MTYLQLLPKNRGSLLPKNPFIVSKSIQQHCGKIDNAYVEGKGTSMVLKVRGKRQVTALLKLTKLIDGTEIDILEHESKNQMRGVVSCGRSLDCTDEEILEGMKDQNVIGMRRLNGKDRKPSATLILTFRGTVLPKYVFFGFTRAPVNTYTPAPMQCFKCYKFGHTKTRCEGKQICRICSQEHELSTDENGKTICNKPAHCVNCTNNHSPAARTCPKYIEEHEIAKIRQDQDVSFGEARRIFNAKHIQTYASTVNSESAVQQRLANAQKEESETVKALRQELAATKKALAELSETLKELAQAKNAVIELEKVKKELADLKKNKTAGISNLTKAQKKALLKKQKRQQTQLDSDEDDNRSPESKKTRKPEQSGIIHIPYVDNQEPSGSRSSTNTYEALNKDYLLDENLQPIPPQSRSSRNPNTEINDSRNRSRSRSP